jgi:hypothetical protein
LVRLITGLPHVRKRRLLRATALPVWRDIRPRPPLDSRRTYGVGTKGIGVRPEDVTPRRPGVQPSGIMTEARCEGATLDVPAARRRGSTIGYTFPRHLRGPPGDTRSCRRGPRFRRVSYSPNRSPRLLNYDRTSHVTKSTLSDGPSTPYRFPIFFLIPRLFFSLTRFLRQTSGVSVGPYYRAALSRPHSISFPTITTTLRRLLLYSYLRTLVRQPALEDSTIIFLNIVAFHPVYYSGIIGRVIPS